MVTESFESRSVSRLVEEWAEKISKSLANTVEAMLLNAENVVSAIRDIDPLGNGARQELLAKARISQSQLSKLEAVGNNATLFRSKKENLPVSFSTLYYLTTLPSEVMLKAIATDLRSKSRLEIEHEFEAPVLNEDQPSEDGPQSCQAPDIEIGKLVRGTIAATSKPTAATYKLMDVVLNQDLPIAKRDELVGKIKTFVEELCEAENSALKPSFREPLPELRKGQKLFNEMKADVKVLYRNLPRKQHPHNPNKKLPKDLSFVMDFHRSYEQCLAEGSFPEVLQIAGRMKWESDADRDAFNAYGRHHIGNGFAPAA